MLERGWCSHAHPKPFQNKLTTSYRIGAYSASFFELADSSIRPLPIPVARTLEEHCVTATRVRLSSNRLAVHQQDYQHA
jgi:hypothetical protein